MITILIADDSALMLRMTAVSVQLQNPDCLIIKAVDGEDAWKKWLLERPELTILDYHMPKLTGIEVLKRIKSANPAAKVAIITSDKQDCTKDEFKNSGADLFFKKCGDKDEMNQGIKKLIDSLEVTA